MGRISNLWVLAGLVLLAVSFCDLHVSADVIPSENECRPYIEKAIHELKNVETTGTDDKDSNESTAGEDGSIEGEAAPETGTEDDGVDSKEDTDGDSTEEAGSENKSEEDNATQENQTEENASLDGEQDDGNSNESAPEAAAADDDNDSKEDGSEDTKSVEDGEQKETDGDSKEDTSEKVDADSKENDTAEKEADDDNSQENAPEDGNDSKENDSATTEDANDSKQTEENQESGEASEAAESDDGSNEQSVEQADAGSLENATAENTTDEDGDSKENANSKEEDGDSKEETDSKQEDGDSKEADTKEDDQDSKEAEGDSKEAEGDSKENSDDSKENNTAENDDEASEEKVRAKRSLPDEAQADDEDSAQADDANSQENTAEDTDGDSKENGADSQEADNDTAENDTKEAGDDSQEAEQASNETAEDEETDEDDLTIEFEIPKNLRPRGHVNELLGLDAESSIKENALRKTGDVILKDLKKVFDNAIKPLESMYKYRDLSNRHFGDPEIFSKPLVLFMGPWSGGKSTILNYLTGNEYTPNSIRSGAEPSPAYFNILMHGDEPEVLDGTQLAADWTFSGLQKFGQGLMDRLRGQKLPSKLLERVNIVEIPGILEVRKQVSRYFPFNDACQWFIDRADIIFLVYDPSKLDVGPETEAILDQLKGREYQTRILLNKADQVKPEELLRVQGALIWNISPLMSSAQPPVMYTVSLWSHPFESGAPIRLLQAQERAFLADLREAIDRRIENKIASARRFAVRIRNHAKMVDCYLTTYYNQKGLFSNKKQVSDKIIENPQNFNIYEGLSTLTNISRYDLPDPEVYLDFFKLNPLYEFKKLSETCTYFKGCPINKLDIAIAYELPELVGKYKKLQEQNLIQLRKEYDENCNVSEPELPVKIINSR